MNTFNPKYHHRRSIRLEGYDYAQEGLYFVTICIQNREHIFGEIINGELHLNAFGEIAENEWLNTSSIRDNVTLHDHIIMPNHIHGIIEINFNKSEASQTGTFQSPSHSIGSIIRGYKIATIKRIKDFILNFDFKNKENDIKEKKNYRTGELQFTPTESKFTPTESKFTPTESKFTPTESKFAPTESKFAPTESKFAPTEKIIKLNFKIWQRNYYEHIIRNRKAYNNISKYIINNPRKWEEDKFNNESNNKKI